MAKNSKMKYSWGTDIAPNIPKNPYLKGKAKPQVVVLHDTGNDRSTIDGEINWMKQNWFNAFVHAWANADKIVETANTDYLCWGGGPRINGIALQIELVHEHEKTRFLKSIDKWIFWSAFQCYWYDIKPTDATDDGNGTIWTHEAVSKFKGGTDHVDPMPYVKQRSKQLLGYEITWKIVFNKLVEYYNALLKGDSTNVKMIGDTSKTVTAEKKKTNDKVKLAKSTFNSWHWSGKFTADKTLKSNITVYRGVGLAKPKVAKGSYIRPGSYVDFDKIYIKDGKWWIRFKYPHNKKAGSFYMSIGNVADGKSFNKTTFKGAVSELKMTTKEQEYALDLIETKALEKAKKKITTKVKTTVKKKAPAKNGVSSKDVIAFCMDLVNNKTAIDMDKRFNSQCMDLTVAVGYKFFGWWASGNAINLVTQPIPTGWQRIKNTPSFVPKRGDILIWSYGQFSTYGHTAIATGVGDTNYFMSVDQNWIGNGDGLVPATLVRHNYNGFWGVIRPPYID